MKKTANSEGFLKTWEALDDMYNELKAELLAQNKAFEGMAYRMLLEQLESNKKLFNHKFFIIAGFNALSTFEERFFQYLIQNYETKLFWDADESYLSNLEQEAGLFIRRYLKLFPDLRNYLIKTSINEKPKMLRLLKLR